MSKVNAFQLFRHLDNFARSLKLREYFLDKPEKPQSLIQTRCRTGWTPSRLRDKYLDLYIEVVQHDIWNSYDRSQSKRYDLTAGEWNTLKQLNSRDDIVLKLAEKGGAIVVMNTSERDFVS